jgi:SAM-dependent methyltransferase
MLESKPQDALIRELKKAGSDALVFNAPLSFARATDSFDFVVRSGAGFVVDFGCGTGSYVRLLVEALPDLRGLGIDLDEDGIETARRGCLEDGHAGRLSFEVGDASLYRGPVDMSICIGSSHVFGNAHEMFNRLAEIQRSGLAIIGDGVWMDTPDAWCLSTFGEMPKGAEGLGAIAEQQGWTVAAESTSSLAEWDDFEFTWNRGVQSVGTELALAFAAQRAEEYQRYRGILGFGWLHLARSQ